MKIIKLTTNNQTTVLAQAVACLQKGGLIIYPTETVYGAGVDATNPQAVQKLLSYKTRREGKPLSIAVSDRKMASLYVEINQQAKNLYQQFLPGPYTVISQSKNNLAPGVASEFNTIGVRIPQYELVVKLVQLLQQPITATSANASGKKRPYAIADLLNNLSQKQKNQIDLIIDAGILPKNEPSVVIDTTLSTPLTMRDTREQYSTTAKAKPRISVFISQNDQETQELAGKILLKYWTQLKTTGLIIGLDGELGAGKTIFAKGIAQFLQIEAKITSPTYTYLKEYQYNRHQVRGNFYHLDLWRVAAAQDLHSLAIDQLCQPKNILAIEWWTQATSLLSTIKPKLLLKIEVLKNNHRQITLIEN